MKRVNLALIILALSLASTNVVKASDLANGISLRNRHYAICAQDATPRPTFYVAGHYVITDPHVRYINSCSPLKHKAHRSRIAAYNYRNYMY